MNQAERRRQVMDRIGNGIAIIPNATQQRRNSDVYYTYRPDSDFYYLTRFPEPESVAILTPGGDEGDYILFCRAKDPDSELWEGRRHGPQGAVETFGADAAFGYDELDEKLPSLLENRDSIHYCLGRYPEFDQRVIGWLNQVRRMVRTGTKAPGGILDLGSILHEMRLFKTEREIEFMATASTVSAEAHRRAMQVCQPGMAEYEIQAEIEYWFQKNNCRTAYPSIVAAGENACILHYTDNSSDMKDGDLLLIDAGAEYDCYAADITRTFPVNGKYTAHQKAVYDVVLEAQRVAIEAVRPGKRYSDVDDAARLTIADGLIDLGILTGSAEEAIENNLVKKYYMHKVGHWLGIDVHDVGEYRDYDGMRRLEPGMYMTVEPGIYLSASDELDEHWHGIGIRIEDDVLVTEDGHRVMTGDVPKSTVEIEALMSG
ncbi:MAG: aminopeptidase P N-terminal domain-containing protein [Acidiferrobacterales bacterium]|nr:aminopeptidase P N-terminal domain-containing protein [Acidiferrobacterales bacterium]